MPQTPTIPNPWYYLDNFSFVLAWVARLYADLLTADEHDFICKFATLPQASQGLLTRMVMRKGSLFRASKLQYPEIGCTRHATQALIEIGWLTPDPVLTLDELFGLLTKTEVVSAFAEPLTELAALKAGKQVQLQKLRPHYAHSRPYSQWLALDDPLYQENVSHLCERLRLMFFGNLRQDWSEFVLSDLGLYTYEKVGFSASSRPFQARQEIDVYVLLHECKKRYLACTLVAELDEVLQQLPTSPYQNDSLEHRRGKLLLQMGLHYERLHAHETALRCYTASRYPGARVQHIRLLERQGEFQAAKKLAQAALDAPESEAEQQQLERMMPRLQRRCGFSVMRASLPAVERLDLSLPMQAKPIRVEEQVRLYLSKDETPAFYVENTLINALFGLLCWDAVFAALPGAFFHPFQQGPADLLRPGFRERRRALFEACFAQLDSEQYKQTILNNFQGKAGIQSPFVFWKALSQRLLDFALHCIPSAHMKAMFVRLLADIRANRSGLPDLVQFWPKEKRYALIEVKGPGDKLQDNQLRWLHYCAAHGIPASVCYVVREGA